jgi:hypothetical protein
MRAVADEYFKTAERQTGEAQGRGVNRAKEAEIFASNQMHVSKLPHQAAKPADKVRPADRGVEKSFSALVKEASAQIQPYPRTPAAKEKKTGSPPIQSGALLNSVRPHYAGADSEAGRWRYSA